MRLAADGMNDRQDLLRELRREVARLCAGFGDEYWQRIDAEKGYPSEFVKAMSDAGHLAALIPEQYGGAGLCVSEAATILEEVQRSGANGGTCHAQLYTMNVLLRHGSEEQRQRYLPEIAAGRLRLQAFGVTEPDAGSDTARISTFARREGDEYVVSGQKLWTSRIEHSDLMLLLVRTTPSEEVAKRTDGLSILLVELDGGALEGLSVKPVLTMMNHHTTEVFLDQVRLPVANLIGTEGKGFEYLLSGLNAERILIGAECVGDAFWFIERATQYAKTREVFGRPIGQNQGVQFPIARAYANTRAAQLMVEGAAARYDAGEGAGAEANLAKLLAADASWEAANVAVQTLGGFGFAAEYHVERKFRETLLYQVAPISTNLILAYIGHQVLGLPRSY